MVHLKSSNALYIFIAMLAVLAISEISWTGSSHQASAADPVVALDQKVYSWTDRIYVTVTDPRSNLDNNIIDFVNVTVHTRNHTISNYMLAETGASTGVFSGYVILTGDPALKNLSAFGNRFAPSGAGPSGNGPTNGLIPAENNDTISVFYLPGWTKLMPLAMKPFNATAPIRWNIGEIRWLQPNYQVGSQAVLQIVDPDMNLNPKAVDTFVTNVWSDTDTGGVKVTMIETGQDTGIFQGLVQLINSTSFGSSLQVSEGDSVTGEYIDRTLPAPPYSVADQLRVTATTYAGTLLYSIKSAPLDIQQMNIVYNTSPPTFSTQYLQSIMSLVNQSDVPEKVTPITNPNIVSAVPGTDTVVQPATNVVSFSGKGTPPIILVSDGSSYHPVSLQTLSLNLNQTVPINIEGNDFPVEPSAAIHGSLIFYATNTADAISEDGGATWRYIDPIDNSSYFLDTRCIDQEVVYDPYHHLFVWEQMGQQHPEPTREKFRLGISSDLHRWKFHDFSLADFDITQRDTFFWDRPHIAITPTNLFVTADLEFVNQAGSYNVMIRIDPTQINPNAPKPKFEMAMSMDGYSITPAAGATDPMYFASQTDHNDHLKIFRWYDNSTAVEPFTRNVDAWTSDILGRQMQCTLPSYDNWCGDRADTRILNGWQIGDRIGFFWNAPQDARHNFNYPFVDGAVFDNTRFEEVGRSYIWSASTPFLYPDSYPTSNGLGWLVFSGNQWPIADVGVTNAQYLANFGPGAPISWTPRSVTSSNVTGIFFGDYGTVRPYDQSGCHWMASGYTYVKSDNSRQPVDLSQPFMTVFNSPNSACSGSSNLINNFTPTQTSSSSGVDLSWGSSSASSGIVTYQIERSSGSGFIPIGQTNSNSFTDNSAVPGTTYTYKIVGITANGDYIDAGETTYTTQSYTAGGNGTTPEFGPAASVILIIAIMSVILVTQRTRISKPGFSFYAT